MRHMLTFDLMPKNVQFSIIRTNPEQAAANLKLLYAVSCVRRAHILLNLLNT